jgi:hypothetical protein
VVADDLVHADARRWLERSIDYLIEHRHNVVVEHGLRTRQVYDSLLERLARRDGRANVEVALLATPAPVSRVAILDRYQTALELTGIGRIVTDTLHDERLDHLRDVADWTGNDHRVAGVSIYRRNHLQPVARLSSMAGSAVRSALESEWQRPWTREESRQFLRVVHSLRARAEPRWHPILDKARGESTGLLADGSEDPVRSRPAVTFGRYQIVSIAHLDTIRTILLDWPTVEIGVLDLQAGTPATPIDVPEHMVEFYRDSDANTDPARNPLSAAERRDLWSATVDAAGLADRVTIAIIPRPELDPDTFNDRYPSAEWDLVFPAPTGTGFDRTRNDHFSEILARPVHTVEPPLEYHTSDIRQAYREGKDSVWPRGLAPGGRQQFIAISGPERLLAPPDSRLPRQPRPIPPPPQRRSGPGTSTNRPSP